MTPVDQGPVYITGLDRSGKTTMRAFLASHSRIAIPAVGSNMFMYFYGQFGDLANSSNLDRCLAAMLRYKHVAFVQPDEQAIRREFADGPATYARLFGIVLSQYARREGKPRWGAQSGLEEQYADVMFAEYPGLKMIHMLRDPRDRYAASLEKWPSGRGRAGGAAGRWSYTVRFAERNLLRHPEAYLVVRFEDLVRDPRGELHRVCSFIGEDVEEQMLEMPGAEKHRDLLRQGSNIDGLLSPEHLGRYREVVDPEEIEFIQLAVGPGMRRWGYDVPTPSAARSARWWVGVVPNQLARMAGWRALEEIHHRFPAQFGRRPGRRMILEGVGR